MVLSFICLGGESATIPVGPAPVPSFTTPTDPLCYLSSLSIKEIQKLAGRKLKFKEKVAVKFFQWKLKKGLTGFQKEETKNKKGTTAMILGIAAIACLVIPYFVLASLPLSILAIVFGNQARKENPGDSRAKAGVILGWATLGLILLALVVILVVLSTWTYGGWG